MAKPDQTGDSSNLLLHSTACVHRLGKTPLPGDTCIDNNSNTIPDNRFHVSGEQYLPKKNNQTLSSSQQTSITSHQTSIETHFPLTPASQTRRLSKTPEKKTPSPTPLEKQFSMRSVSTPWRLTHGDVNVHELIKNTPSILLTEIPKITTSTFPDLMTKIQYHDNSIIKNFILLCTPKISAAIKSTHSIDLRDTKTFTIQGCKITFLLRITKIITYNLFTRLFVNDTIEWSFEYFAVGTISTEWWCFKRDDCIRTLHTFVDRIISDSQQDKYVEMDE